jgi:uncharacterized protein (DUF2141 family)
MKRQIKVLIVLFLITPLQARIITVDDDGPADFNNIQDAIDDANDNDTITVAAGTYYENIRIAWKDDIKIEGAGADVTTINGDQNGHVVVFNPASGSISGFTITNSGNSPSYSAGVFTSQSEVIVEDNFITNNSNGIFISSNSTAYINNNRITNNRGNSFSINIEVSSSTATITNNLIVDSSWAGIEGSLSSLSRIVGNTIAYHDFCGIINSGTEPSNIYNNIVIGNEYGIFLLGSSNSPVPMADISYNNVWNNSEYNYYAEWGTACIPEDPGCIPVVGSEPFDPQPGTGEMSVDPLFADAAGGDFHLKSAAGRWNPNTQTWVADLNTSLCIDAGNPGCPVGDEPDPNGNRINMGAFGGTAQASKSPPDWALLSDMTNDRTNNFADLKVLVDYWLTAGQCLPPDLDRSGFVDPADYSIFANQFGLTASPPSGFNYNIGSCQNEGVQTDSFPTLPPFSISVEGRYIYFEDVMYANCCPDVLGLHMETVGNQITLYESAFGGMCDCMCYFPVTATIGPLEDGTYIIDVFDNYGQWRGNAEVTIDGYSQSTVNYQVSNCDMSMSASEDEPNSTTDFTITVDGQYIHFEDIMIANCCQDKLEIQTIIDANQITINEIETTTAGCRCTCEFPVKATIGPLEDGTYTIEVFDNYGQSKGTVQITIGQPHQPQVDYRIGTCQSQASALPNTATRFTLTVVGLYIHFHDMMVANCCPETLGLEASVNNDLILIYETENTIMPCLCICDYPVSATIGPFEPGTYTVEVYEDYGGFIGSEVITIAP